MTSGSATIEQKANFLKKLISLYIKILENIYKNENPCILFEYQKMTQYESNIEGCMLDLISVLNEEDDNGSDLSFKSDSSDDDQLIAKLSKSNYW